MTETSEDEGVVYLQDRFDGVKKDPAKMLRALAKDKPKEAIVVYELEDGSMAYETSSTDLHYVQSLLFTFAVRVGMEIIQDD